MSPPAPSAAQELREEVEHLQAIYDYGDMRYVENEELREMSSAQGFHGGPGYALSPPAPAKLLPSAGSRSR
jgi:hypothetical protein